MIELDESFAAAILRKAIDTGRSAELLNNLFEGGSVTLDATTGDLIIFSGFAINDLINGGSYE